MKRLLLLLIALTSTTYSAIKDVDDITYEFLIETGEKTGYCDHVYVFKKIFETIEVKTMLEFGVGYSTKYFLDHCKKVISVEFISPGWMPNWIKYCLDLYKEYSNWVPVAYFSGYKGDYSWAQYKFFGTDGFFKAGNHFAVTGQSYRKVDPAYFNELSTFIGNLSKYNKFDIALVDPGSVLRGEIAEILFGKVPIIITCDAASSRNGYDPYGLCNFKVPEDYEEIFFSYGKGTIVWIQKKETLLKLIEVLKEYAK
ncbi:MAG: hypothetical protein K1X28_05445 [Parachlamydiales bacterium]|nr:hypothetical protein [Parachlamydiales bacterium]